MLRPDENDRLTRVGPGTPMGELLRRYWQPTLLSSELPEPASPPIRVRLLGEDLVAFRDGAGRVGVMDQMCPHRGASLFFGCTEADGLRCAYHGWKFDVDGRCIDMPSEPPQSRFKEKIRQKAYVAREQGGVIWIYMGPPERMPALPELEWTLVPDSQRYTTKRLQESNWLQGVEGGLDPRHTSFLHAGSFDHLPPALQQSASNDQLVEWEMMPLENGFLVALKRPQKDGTYSWRTMHYLAPFYVNLPPFAHLPFFAHAWVPIDDENTWTFTIHWQQDGPIPDEEIAAYEAGVGSHVKLIPGTFRPIANKSNDYLLDRSLHRRGLLTPISGIGMQDQAIQESMGPIQDRTREHLGTSDTCVIAMRRYLLDAVKAVEEGRDAPGLDPKSFRARGSDVRLPAGVPYTEPGLNTNGARSPGGVTSQR